MKELPLKSDDETRVRFLVVAYSVPQRASGTPVVIRRLLENFDADEVALIGRPINPKTKLESGDFKYPVINILAPPVDTRGERFWRIACVLTGIIAGLRAIRKYSAQVIMSVYPDEGSLLTGYLLHKITGLPLVPYLCDLYLEQNKTNWQGKLAAWLQPRVFRAALNVLVLNEGMRQFYWDRYKLNSIVIPTCIGNIPEPMITASRRNGHPFVIGYSGNVNDARIDPLRVLVKAVGARSEFAIRYFTPQAREYLEQLGLWTANSERFFFRNEAELRRELSNCDALYLPLTFNKARPDVDSMATCLGTKSYEYLVSGIPVVVHCPTEYFTSRFYRDNNCGILVTELDPSLLLSALTALRNNPKHSDVLVRNALCTAKSFDGEIVAANLRKTLVRLLMRSNDSKNETSAVHA
jgi:glycosyltransferase involved in cell wall biosynthesis